MPRRVSDNFRAGFISDSYSTANSVSQLHNMYLRESGEAVSRGRIGTNAVTAEQFPGTGFWYMRNPKARSVGFHPNFGIGLSVGFASSTASAATASPNMFTYNRNALVASPLLNTQPVASAYPYQTSLTWRVVSEGLHGSIVPITATAATASASVTGLEMEPIINTVVTGDEMILCSEFGSIYKWGGSTNRPYNTGSVTIANSAAAAIATTPGTGGRIITGTGTSWAANVQAGQYILIGTVGQATGGTGNRAFRITRVISNTQLEIESPIYTIAAQPLSYRIQSMAVVQSPNGTWNRTNERPTTGGPAAFHNSRLYVGVCSDYNTSYNTIFNYDRVRWSGSRDEYGAPGTVAVTSAGVATGLPSNSGGGGDGGGVYSNFDLWHPNAFVDIAPGVGGSIQGLCSFNDELLVIKNHAMFRLTGSNGWNGESAGSKVQLINKDVGAVNPRAWVETSRGVVVADADGLYLYDGEKVASITDGRVQEFWKFNYAVNSQSITLTEFEDKVYVSMGASGLIWDVEKDYFYTLDHRANELINCVGCSVYAGDDSYVGDFLFSGEPIAVPGTTTAYNAAFTVGDFTNVNHKRSNYVLPSVSGTPPYTLYQSVGAAPAASLRTIPIPLSEEVFGEGRLHNVYVHFALRNPLYGPFPSGTSNPLYSSYLAIEVVYGRSQAINPDADDQVTIASKPPYATPSQRQVNLPDKAQTLAVGSFTERTVRFPIDDSVVSNAVSIRVYASVNADTAQSVDVTDKLIIYGIAVDYEPVNILANDADMDDS